MTDEVKNIIREYPAKKAKAIAATRAERLAHTLNAFAAEHVRALLADNATRLAIKSAVMGANRWLPAGCSNVEAAGEIADQVLAALRRKALGELVH